MCFLMMTMVTASSVRCIISMDVESHSEFLFSVVTLLVLVGFFLDRNMQTNYAHESSLFVGVSTYCTVPYFPHQLLLFLFLSKLTEHLKTCLHHAEDADS
jgi:hypothetical protein